jgi:hypothetical protein
MGIIKTIKSIFKTKIRNTNRALQVSNCIDLIDDQQVKLAESFKKINKVILELEDKLTYAKEKVKSEKKADVKVVLQKNVDVITSTIERLKKNKELVADKLKKTEDSRTVLAAKKSLLDSIESLKGMSSNVFEKSDFDVDAIMAEIDKSIRDIEADFQSDAELNELVK